MTFQIYPIDWWLDRLDGVKPSGSGWTAICPGHPDPKPSLSITIAEDGDVLVHCFAGCKYSDILAGLDDVVPSRVVLSPSTSPTSNMTSKEWWETYTGIPADFWTSLGVIFMGDGVMFSWPNTTIRKVRTTSTKIFSWIPDNMASPPLWPAIPESCPEDFILCEGESDTGILRFCGVDAWGVTKGAATPRLDAVFTELKRRGVRRVISMFDVDSSGKKGSDVVQSVVELAGLEYAEAAMSEVIDPLLGEKDIRDVWLRLRDPEKFRLLPYIFARRDNHRKYERLDIFLGRQIPSAVWWVKNLILRETVQMVVGAPKIGKSWLVLDLAVSVASGTKFMGQFDVTHTAPVILITKEDPDYLLQDRLRKIMSSKGLGGSIVASGNQSRVSMPEDDVLLFLDLNRDFLFDDASSVSLFQYLDEIKSTYGEVGLVIIDPTLRMIQGVDEFKASDIASSVFRIAEKIKTRYKSGVVLVHHKAKGSGEVVKQSYGSMAFHAFAEGTWYLGNRDDEGWVTVHSEFKSARENDWRYRFIDLEDDYVVEVSTEVPVKLSTSRGDADLPKKIEVLLSKINTGLTVPQIAEAIDGSSDYMVRQALKVLDGHRRVERRKDTSPKSTAGAKSDLWFLVS